MIVISLLEPAKTLALISRIPEGSVTVSNDVQYAKEDGTSDTSRLLVPKSMLVRPWQFWKDVPPTLVTETREILVKFLHEVNTFDPIVCTFPRLTLFKYPHDVKALFPIVVTVDGIVIDARTLFT